MDLRSLCTRVFVGGLGLAGLAFAPPAMSMLPVILPQVFDITPDRIDDEVRKADALAQAYAQFKPLWDRAKITSLTYTLTRFTLDSASPNSCDGVPVRIEIRRGKLKSASYEQTLGDCQSGRSVDRNKQPDRVLTAKDLWAALDDALSHRATHDCEATAGDCRKVVCLHVTFEAQTGLPLLIEGGCGWDPLGYWKLEVSNLKIEPAT